MKFQFVWNPTKLLISLVGLVVAAFVVMYPVLAIRRHTAQFVARAAEAQSLIDAVYTNYYKKGTWPDSVEGMRDPVIKTAPADWQFAPSDPNGMEPPIVWIRGPLHMRMMYEFRKDGQLDSPGGWSLTSEGSPWPGTFIERIPQRKVAPE